MFCPCTKETGQNNKGTWKRSAIPKGQMHQRQRILWKRRRKSQKIQDSQTLCGANENGWWDMTADRSLSRGTNTKKTNRTRRQNARAKNKMLSHKGEKRKRTEINLCWTATEFPITLLPVCISSAAASPSTLLLRSTRHTCDFAPEVVRKANQMWEFDAAGNVSEINNQRVLSIRDKLWWAKCFGTGGIVKKKQNTWLMADIIEDVKSFHFHYKDP